MSLAGVIALVPPGQTRFPGAIQGLIKVARGRALAIERSSLVFLDEAGAEVEEHGQAFGLVAGAQLSGPLCQHVREERRGPRGAVRMRWQLDDLPPAEVWTRPQTEPLRLTLFPFQVPVPDDVHLRVHLIHQGARALSASQVVSEAVLWLDGRPHAYEIDGWNGRAYVEPGGTLTQYLSLDDFPTAPRSGRGRASFAMAGCRTPEQAVEWTGEPFATGAPGS
jgi:hypothetical protein